MLAGDRFQQRVKHLRLDVARKQRTEYQSIGARPAIVQFCFRPLKLSRFVSYLGFGFAVPRKCFLRLLNSPTQCDIPRTTVNLTCGGEIMDDLHSSPPTITSSAGGVDDRHGTPPKWVSVTGAFFFGATLVFFMVLVIVSVLRFEVPASARFLVLIVLALGAAGSFGFLGGAAAASGSIPIPGVQHNVVAFSTAGGVAILVIVLSLGYYLYARSGKI